MKTVEAINDPSVNQALLGGGVVALRTDTIYGLLARADDEQAVEKVYRLKRRTPSKSPIVLIANYQQLYDQPEPELKALMEEHWPGRVSIVVPSALAPSWIKRQNDSVAYRMPASDDLLQLVAKTGPLIAPSANPEGGQPACSLGQAKDYFQDKVDIYIDGGTVYDQAPSRLARFTSGGVEWLR